MKLKSPRCQWVKNVILLILPSIFLPVPPTIEEQQTEFTVVREREVLLPCRVEGVPTPTVTWEKDGVPIAPGDFHYRVLRTGRLAIPITTIEDSGAYTCIAENDAGRASVLIDLIVQGEV